MGPVVSSSEEENLHRYSKKANRNSSAIYGGPKSHRPWVTIQQQWNEQQDSALNQQTCVKEARPAREARRKRPFTVTEKHPFKNAQTRLATESWCWAGKMQFKYRIENGCNMEFKEEIRAEEGGLNRLPEKLRFFFFLFSSNCLWFTFVERFRFLKLVCCC